MKIRRFEEIEAWQEARKLVRIVYEAINKSEGVYSISVYFKIFISRNSKYFLCSFRYELH